MLDFISQNTLLWGLFGLAFLFFVTISLILAYHWERYTSSTIVPRTTMLIYYIVGFSLLGIMLISLLLHFRKP